MGPAQEQTLVRAGGSLVPFETPLRRSSVHLHTLCSGPLFLCCTRSCVLSENESSDGGDTSGLSTSGESLLPV